MIINHTYDVEISNQLYKKVVIDDKSGRLVESFYPAHIPDEEIFEEIKRMYQEISNSALKQLMNDFKGTGEL